MPNIKFNYLYRDAANYKQFGFQIFKNPHQITLKEFETLIKTELIDGEYFYVSKWELPDLHFNTWDDETDHTFHEFESVEYTDEPPNTLLNLGEFVTLIKNTNWI
jgi:hypothetical protein